MNKPLNLKRILYIIIPLILAALVVIKLKNNKEITQKKVFTYNKEQAIHVEVQTAKLEPMNAEMSYSGTFEANKETKISAETQGKINQILVTEGTFVHQGQKLIQLDNALLQQQLIILEVQINNANAENQIQLNSTQIQIDELNNDVNRFSILAQADAIQGIQLEKAQVQLKTALNQKKTLLQQSVIKNLMAQKNNVSVQINKTTIVAPFSGIVTMKFSEVGAFAAPGVPLLQITDLGILKFTINVSEKELNQFQFGKIFSIKADIQTNQSLLGKISLVGSKANVGGSYPIQFTVQNLADYKIKAGMFGKVSIIHDSNEMGFLIPSSAIIGNAAQPQIYIVKDGKVKMQTISVSKKIQDKSFVTSGINEGDIIVINGLINLFDGANVSFK